MRDLAQELAGLSPDEIAETQLDIVVDRLVVKSGIAQRLADSLETALRYGKDVVKVLVEPFDSAPLRSGCEERLFTQRLICPACGFAYPELSPAFFSPNSPEGACPACEGLGIQQERVTKKRGKPRPWPNRISVLSVNGSRLRSETQGIRIEGRS